MSHTTASTSLWVMVSKSNPLGKTLRNLPFVFSFVPRCQGAWGSAKNTFAFISRSILRQSENADPRSKVNDRASSFSFRAMISPCTGSHPSYGMMTASSNRLFRSVRVRSELFGPRTVSPSKCRVRLRCSAPGDRSRIPRTSCVQPCFFSRFEPYRLRFFPRWGSNALRSGRERYIHA